MKYLDLPVHIHFHPHYAVQDYEGVENLAQIEEDPFLIILPEVPKGEVVRQLQKLSDGDKSLLDFFISKDEQHNDIVTYDQNAARMRAMAEIVFDTGLVVVSAHPAFDENTAGNNALALGKDRRLRQTLGEAVSSLQEEFPAIAEVIRERDEFSATHFRTEVTNAIRKYPDLKTIDRVPCLMEIGSLHFMLAEMLRDNGENVEVSGEHTPEKQTGSFNQALAQFIVGDSPSDIDFELVAMEDLLANSIFTDSSSSTHQIIDEVLGQYPRFTWADFYHKQRKELAIARQEV